MVASTISNWKCGFTYFLASIAAGGWKYNARKSSPNNKGASKNPRRLTPPDTEHQKEMGLVSVGVYLEQLEQLSKLECIIPHPKLTEVRQALSEKMGIHEIIVTEVNGYGYKKAALEHYRGVEYITEIDPKYKLDILIRNYQITDTIKTVEEAVKTADAAYAVEWLS